MGGLRLRHLAGAAVVFALVALPLAAAAPEPPPAFLDAFGSSGSGDGEFDAPADVAVNPVTGLVYVLDSANNRVQVFTGDGDFVDEWGGPGIIEGDFVFPQGIAVNPLSGDVYVADTGNSRVQRFDADGDHLDTYGYELLGLPAPLPAGPFDLTDGFVAPMDVAVNPGSGKVYVADSGNNRIMRFDAGLDYEEKWGLDNGLPGVDEGEFVLPTGVAVDPATGEVYVTDNGNSRVQKFSGGGSFKKEWGGAGSGDGEFDDPNGPAVGPGGTVFVADTGNERIQKFDPSGGFLTAWGTSGSGFGQFDSPNGIAAVPSGHVFVADLGNDRIQVFGPRAATLVVDDDGYALPGDCDAPYPSFAFSRIQYAVDFARPGEVILVCPGSYPEHVTVDKQLRLTGPGPSPTAGSCNRPAASDPALQAVVRGSTVPGAPTVLLDADAITWQGFVVETAVDGPGLATVPTHGSYVIRFNLVQGNQVGIVLESGGGTTVIRNCVRQNGASGPSSGYGIRSTVLLRSTRVVSNFFFANPTLAFAAEGSTQSLDLSSNRSRRDGAFAQISGASSSRVNANIVHSALGFGIRADGTSALQVRGNIIEDAGGEGIALAAATSTRPVISGNIVQRAGGNGIVLGAGASTGARLQGNISQFNAANGILLEAGGSSGGSLRGNIAKLNGGDGIRIDAGNAGNTLSGNIARSNRPHDCHDSSTGNKTAGTANTWNFRRNICGTQNRNGLSHFALTAPPVHPASHP